MHPLPFLPQICHFLHQQGSEPTDKLSQRQFSGALTPLFTKQATFGTQRACTGTQETRAGRPDTAPPVCTQLAPSSGGQANPAPAFSAVRQLKAHVLLASGGENVLWQTSAFALSSHPSADMLSLHKAQAQDQPPTGGGGGGGGGNLYNPSEWEQTSLAFLNSHKRLEAS